MERSPGLKLLIVEDDAETADYLQRGLAERGHAADLIGNGVDGLAAALGQKYDAIVLDRGLPGLDGLSLLRALRAAGNKTPVLLRSARSTTGCRGWRLGPMTTSPSPSPFAS
jgi:two-component system, OmpR family, response regulator